MISRSVALSRTLQNLVFKTNLKPVTVQSVRHSGHIVSYRQPPPQASRATRIGAEAAGALMWWWILWHLWHEPEHLTGEFPYPDPSSWTNAELGIPPDN